MEALATVLAQHALGRWVEVAPERYQRSCTCGERVASQSTDAMDDSYRRHIAAVLASDWLRDHDAARDSEHEREVAALRERKETYHEQWMLTERDLADLHAAIKALADEWERPVPKVQGTPEDAAAVLRERLLRDDAAGAGGGS